jgi:hypothetical protein
LAAATTSSESPIAAAAAAAAATEYATELKSVQLAATVESADTDCDIASQDARNGTWVSRHAHELVAYWTRGNGRPT